MSLEDLFRANAEMIIHQLGPLSGLEFGYNVNSVAWVDGFIEQQRTRSNPNQRPKDEWITVLGSFLGECIIRCFGGQWKNVNGQWAIHFDNRNAVYPFAKVHKRFASGLEDSIEIFFKNIPILFTVSLGEVDQPHTEKAADMLIFFTRQAEEAYTRFYEARSDSERSAVYNDCKESMAEAIRLSRLLGLDQNTADLEKKLTHYKNVFRHQMNF